MMQVEINNIVIVGGGTAGWITAGLLAAKYAKSKPSSINITLVESPDIPTIGVGEGTWPSMRETLKAIGIDEADLFLHCDASFKQASKFIDWEKESFRQKCKADRYYYHPFSLPFVDNGFDLGVVVGENFSESEHAYSFVQQVCYQSILCEKNLSPKLITTKAYDYIANYGYHINATKFSELLKNHCINKLNVKHVLSHITQVHNNDKNNIAFISTVSQGDIYGDLFIDCTGAQSLLLGKHYKIPFCSQKKILFNDTALAVQIPYESANSPIASCTHSTALTAGWIWDIALQSRRGVGYVYSSQHLTDIQAETELDQYIKQIGLPEQTE
jgi:hypothetical protein